METTPDLPPPLQLFRMITGYYVSRALYIIATLGVADRLANGALGHEELAKDTATHAPALRRVLRLLASVGVFSERPDGRFALTPIGACLRDGVPGSMRAAARLFGGVTQDRWADLLYSVQTGEPAFRKQAGADGPFGGIAADPELAALFDEAMADWTKHVAVAAVAAYDFARFDTIVDVGGGNGTLLAGILGVTPGPRGIVFDLPHVVERAQAHLAEVGVVDRCTAVGGDFFQDIPCGGDAYLLKHVIHDWNDERAVQILTMCRRAMGPDARLLIIEGVYPERIDESSESQGAAANDVNMLVCTGGRQRSEAEFHALYAAAGFTLTRMVPTPPLPTRIIEGVLRL
jgi:hypothetical protein